MNNISTYSYPLFLQNRKDEALTVVSSVSREQLEIPSVAAYFGIIQANFGHKDAARGPLRRAEAAALLPEEKEIVRQALAKLWERLMAASCWLNDKCRPLRQPGRLPLQPQDVEPIRGLEARPTLLRAPFELREHHGDRVQIVLDRIIPVRVIGVQHQREGKSFTGGCRHVTG